MNPASLPFLPLVFSLGGAFTPCALGNNAVLGYIFRPLPLPYLSLAPAVAGHGEAYRASRNGVLAMGAIFGLDIPACNSPLVLALLAEMVLVGNYLFGAVALSEITPEHLWRPSTGKRFIAPLYQDRGRNWVS